MSLLSRFRRSVVPVSSKKKTHSDDSRLYNYRKPTKSFNEKSVIKSKNLPAYTDSAHGDGTTTAGNQYHHRQEQQHDHHQQQPSNQNSREKVAVRNSSGNMSKSLPFTTNKTSKPKTNKNTFDNGSLSRSNTFTLEEERHAQNETYPYAKRKEKPLNSGEMTAGSEYDARKSKWKKFSENAQRIQKKPHLTEKRINDFRAVDITITRCSYLHSNQILLFYMYLLIQLFSCTIF